MEIRLSGIIKESIVDGNGIRMVVFTQGCPHNCEGCHNPQTHDINGGYMADIDEIFREFKSDPLLSGITFSGGEPFIQPVPLTELAKMVKSINKSVISYTGFTFEELIHISESKPEVLELLKNIDYLIDGRFILSQRSLTLKFRGSKNQRIIDVRKSLENNIVIETEL